MDGPHRLVARKQLTAPLWKEMHFWLKLERGRVPDGGRIPAAVDYSLPSWPALTQHLEDGAASIDNNFIERQIKPWAMEGIIALWASRHGECQAAHSESASWCRMLGVRSCTFGALCEV